MIAQHPAIIYKSDFRRSLVTDTYWRLISLDKKEHEKQSTFSGNIDFFEEIVLNAQESISHSLSGNQVVLLIPIIGAIDFNSEHSQGFVHIGQIQFLNITKEETLQIKNPYEKDRASYLIASFPDVSIENQTLNFEYENNTLTTLLKTANFSITTGLFSAREEDVYKVNNPNNSVFTFVVNGAFEFQNRLLENRDALSIWDIDEIEFEALTNNSIIFLFEVTNKTK